MENTFSRISRGQGGSSQFAHTGRAGLVEIKGATRGAGNT